MKTIQYSLMLAAAACGFANAQTTAYTTPVGYITHTVNSLNGQTALTILGPALVQPKVFAGVTTGTPSASKVANFTASVPTGLDGSYVLEITSGTNQGWWSTVVSSTAGSITVNDNFPAGISSAGVSVSVRKHNTVQSFFGENTAGLIPSDGATGDEIQILNPDQSLTPISYFPASVSGDGDDWYNLSTSELANNQIIEPGSAVIVKTNRATSLSFVSTGEVKTTKTQVDVFPGLTLLAQPQAAGGSYNGLGLQSALIPVNANADNTDYDEFQILNADQSLTPNAAADPALFGTATMYNLATSEDSGAVVISGGAGAIIKRNSTKSASVITVNGTTVGQ